MVLRASAMPAAYCAISAKRTGCPASATMVATSGSCSDSRWSSRACRVSRSFPCRKIGPGPFVERPPGLRDGPADLLQRCGAELRDRGLVGRIHDREGVVALHPLTGYERSPFREDLARSHETNQRRRRR